MKIILSHITALLFWRAYRGKKPVRMTGAEQRAFLRKHAKEGAPGRNECELLRALGLPGVEEPFHLMVSDMAKFHNNEKIVFHLLPDDLPAGSLVLIASDVAVCSPELAFVQYAGIFGDVEQTTMFGFELCGTYRFNTSIRKFSYDVNHPVLSVKRTEEFLGSLSKIKGLPTARKAVEFLLEDSASPMETTAVLLLCLPHRVGGYGLMYPLLNYEIVRTNGPDEFERNSYRCDLCWPEQKVCVEYDSDYSHSDVEQMARDSAKRAALNAMGYTVIEVTRPQIMNEDSFDEVAQALFAALGYRPRIRISDFEDRKRVLRQKILHSFSEYR